MKLYYSPGACSLADHIALVESGLPFESEKVDLKTKRTAGGEDFTTINPKGYVPALRLDDGEVLTENIAILSFIADTSGRLMPRSGMQRWRVLEMTAFISTEIHKSHKPLFVRDSTDEAKAAAKEQLAKRYALVEEQLGGRDFIVGDEMTIADCYLFVMLFWAKNALKLDVPAGLTTYYERMSQHPSVRKALAEEGIG